MALPDDDSPIRSRPALDEIAISHEAMGIVPSSSNYGSSATNNNSPASSGSANSGFGNIPSTTMASAPVVMQNNIGMMGNNDAAAEVMAESAASQAQAQAQVGIAQTTIDDRIVDSQLKKQDEHWIKSYWRPCAGWLYMIICFMDFVGFPLLSMFLPVVLKPMGITIPYTPWTSLTLSNGGLIHLAFGAILGIAAYTRGAEKLSMLNR